MVVFVLIVLDYMFLNSSIHSYFTFYIHFHFPSSSSILVSNASIKSGVQTLDKNKIYKR